MGAFGAGSSVEGNFSAPHSGITIEFTHMDKILAFHPDDLDVVVQPGVNLVNLNNEIKDSGLLLPLDPSPTAMIGGMVSTNCSGTNAMRYGNMKDWAINLTVVLADGRVVKTRRRPRKTSAGYNLTGFFVGAEGTLGLVTEITLKLAPIPQDTSVAIVSFPRVRAAITAASRIIRSGIQLAAFELMDDVQMQVVNRHGSAAVKIRKWEEEPTLFMKFSGTTDAIKSDIKRVQELIKNEKPGPLHFAKPKLEELDLWAARKEALFTMVSTRKEGNVLWSTDVAVPLSRLAVIIGENISKDECSKLGIFGTVTGHVGDTAMFYDPHNAEQKAAVKKVVDDMMHRALEMDGTVSGEHAIGIGKKDCLVEELGQGTIDFMKTLKRAADPKHAALWLLNPGKVFDLPHST
ncbi:hypothetical protein TI39_contig323g00001 [Zymoseptoria brevis]|uniref:FAD-binding PCMH-type domain-containing protein n=1 Tax=Zymoseptoria brevis TaxID=1047168 RepID=A0A0F4GT10_9PEZI|nr:hypothetical protein TI39_contig323g00001 [Zymoseptoria brevis]